MIRLLDPGFLTSVQDAARYGLARFGLSEAGPAAPISFRIANFLAGNPKPKPSLEVTLKPPRILFRADATLGFGGADFAWKIDGRPIDTRFTLQVRAGSTLHGDYCRTGLRGYIAFLGGLPVEAIQSSAASHLQAQVGGHRLERDQDLPLPPTSTTSPRRLREALPPPLITNHLKTLRIVPGVHHPLFAAEALSLFSGATYRVTEHSTRVALRLDGLALPSLKEPIQTSGAWHGAVQVPPSGIPQVLGCEHPATGGYPILASVIEADQEVLGQLRPREEIRFGLVSLRTALELLKRLEAWWHSAAT
jgi:antagonist of KipI